MKYLLRSVEHPYRSTVWGPYYADNEFTWRNAAIHEKGGSAHLADT
jgi:hypothetical protein